MDKCAMKCAWKHLFIRRSNRGPDIELYAHKRYYSLIWFCTKVIPFPHAPPFSFVY